MVDLFERCYTENVDGANVKEVLLAVADEGMPFPDQTRSCSAGNLLKYSTETDDGGRGKQLNQ